MARHVIIPLVLLVVLLTIPPVSAGPVDDAASAAVKNGITSFLYYIGDAMMGINGETALTNGTAANATQSPGMIFDMITYTIDPFSMPFVQGWWGTSLVFFVMVALSYILLGGGFALLATKFPSVMERLAWLESGTYQSNFQLKEWFSSVILALLFPFITYFGIYVILEICYVVTALLTDSALEAVPPTADNIIAYLFMSFAYLVLSILMGIRTLVIVLFAAGGLMLAALFLIPSLKGLVHNIFMYVLLLIFMQPILVFVAAVGVVLLKNIPPSLQFYTPALYISLIIVMMLIGVIFIFGYTTLYRMIFMGRYIL